MFKKTDAYDWKLICNLANWNISSYFNCNCFFLLFFYRCYRIKKNNLANINGSSFAWWLQTIYKKITRKNSLKYMAVNFLIVVLKNNLKTKLGEKSSCELCHTFFP